MKYKATSGWLLTLKNTHNWEKAFFIFINFPEVCLKYSDQ